MAPASKVGAGSEDVKLLRSDLTMDLCWRVAAGQTFTVFAEALKERRILGRLCPHCKLVYLPPRPLCGDCLVELNDWVEVGPQGTVEAITVVHHAITDPVAGEARPVPYAMGLIRLDGASTTLNHCLIGDASHRGTRVEPVWRDERTGTMRDIETFKEAK